MYTVLFLKIFSHFTFASFYCSNSFLGLLGSMFIVILVNEKNARFTAASQLLVFSLEPRLSHTYSLSRSRLKLHYLPKKFKKYISSITSILQDNSLALAQKLFDTFYSFWRNKEKFNHSSVIFSYCQSSIFLLQNTKMFK